MYNSPSEFSTWLLPEQVTFMSEDERELFEERSAIMEYEAGLSREEAEYRALELIVARKQMAA